jgi:hypothetical protein
MIKLDPVKVSNSEYARGKIVNQIESYLSQASDWITQGEKKAWGMLNKVLRMKRGE